MCSGGWVKDHKKELLTALAVGGTVASAGALAPFGAVAGASLLPAEIAGGVGAAELGAGGGLLEGFSTAQQLAAAGAGSEGAGDALSGGLLSPMQGNFANISPGLQSSLGDKLGTGLERFGKVAYLAKLAGIGDQRQQPPMAPPAGVQPLQTQSGIPSFAQTFPTNIIDEERKRRLMQQRGYL